MTNATGEAKSKTTTPSLKFDNAPADIILQAYAQETGKTLLMAPDAPKANITLKSQPEVELTKEEYIEAIEVVLGMHGIDLEPFGEKFVKVLARKTIRTDGIPILMEGPAGGHPEKSKMVSQMIQLKSIAVAEAQKALEGFKKPDGLFQIFERTNSILVTDTQENVNRMMEIVKFIDQPMIATEEVNVRTVRFAKAEDIKKRLEELVAESQKQQQAKEEIKANVSGAPGITRTSSSSLTTSRPLPPGLTRLGSTPQPPKATPNETLEALIGDADRGMIRGKVQIIADERTNQLIIITRSENMMFFDRIITVLDIETLPDVKVEVMRLEYADAEEVSTMLNDLIGNVTSKKDDKAPSGAAKSGSTTPSGAPATPAKSTTLAEAVAARTTRADTAESGEPGKSKLGQLSKDNIKILSDKRTNALVMMGSAGDLAAVKEIVKGMDIQLAQVLIETVALEVGLGDTLDTGLDWVRRVKEPKTHVEKYVDENGVVQSRTVTDTDYLYGAGGGGGKGVAQDLFALGTNALNGVVTSGGAGIEYLATIDSLNLDVIIKAAKSDSLAKVLSSPVLLTVDNKEATMEATETKYMYKGMRYMGYSGGTSGYGGGSYEPDIEQRDVGLSVKVTPRISPSGNVVLTVEETFEEVLGSQTINGQEWPTVTSRKLSADVSVGNGETVILGGLVKTAKSHNESGIPILKDIPYIGKYLFGSVSDKEARSELLVFLTPYVIETPEDMARETHRRKDYINATDIWTKGWSDSKLADPVSVSEMKERLGRKKEMEKAWRMYREKLEEQQEVEARVDEERTQTEVVLSKRPSAEPKPIGTLTVEETVEVLKPEDGMDEPADPAAGAEGEGEPVPPVVEKPRKSWWSRMF
jgi:type II secretion system protein D